MNYIVNVSDFLYIILCANDTSVLLNGKDYAYLIELLNSELEKVSIWLKANKLILNVKKTYYICFLDPESKLTFMLSSPWIKFISKELTVLNNLVIIDDRLNWTQQVQSYMIVRKSLCKKNFPKVMA